MPAPNRDPRNYKKRRRADGLNHARALNFSCFHNRPFLTSDRARQWLLDATRLALHAYRVDLWAWCIMPTHYHILVYPPNPNTEIGRFLSTLKLSVTKRAVLWVKANAPDKLAAMADIQPNGHTSYRFWQRGGGYDRNLFTARAIWKMVDYIHNNPVEDKLAAHAADWPWSSAATYARSQPSLLPLILDHLPPRP